MEEGNIESIRVQVILSYFLEVVPRVGLVSKRFFILYFVTRRNSHEEEDHLTCWTALHSCSTRCL
ncbi:conserved hypothetical protein [Leptospira interrogans serovar Copenhageni str. Fiocruz L1-130]|uniref:Uncharacterized protein n=1 Tax=Leptospira interrogans serogroup Icterohaemorrhagiae serovar copenhageni (strain Fiocruz L1-130) TaxID=267671 RepID=Q72U76_LEPIC|nr:conserved hypothetical protein [Leptospira interrogans serovar Copenhageni str. Fiocruz L1-130]